MTPHDIAKSGTEHGHQAALFAWARAMARTKWPELEWFYAIPNGGERSAATAGRLKAEGVKSGVSDTCLPVQRRSYVGLYIEMKKPASPGKPAGKESSEQKAFGAFVQSQGYFYVCCYDWETAARWIAWYMGVNDGSY